MPPVRLKELCDFELRRKKRSSKRQWLGEIVRCVRWKCLATQQCLRCLKRGSLAASKPHAFRMFAHVSVKLIQWNRPMSLNFEGIILEPSTGYFPYSVQTPRLEKNS